MGREGRSAEGTNADLAENLPKLMGELISPNPGGGMNATEPRALPGAKTPGPARIDPRAAPPKKTDKGATPWLR